MSVIQEAWIAGVSARRVDELPQAMGMNGISKSSVIKLCKDIDERVNAFLSMRRFTRLTNAFSKKFDNHVHALSLYFVFYNFCRIHKTLRVSPAMAAGVADRLWSLEDVITRIDADAAPAKSRGPYKKRA